MASVELQVEGRRDEDEVDVEIDMLCYKSNLTPVPKRACDDFSTAYPIVHL